MSHPADRREPSDQPSDPSAGSDPSAAPAESADSAKSASSAKSADSAGHGGRRHRSRLPLVLALAALCLLIDQVAKSLAVANLNPADPPRLLGGLVYLSLLRNPGAAWSIGGDTGMTWIFAIVAVIVAVVIVRIATKLTSTLWAVSLGLVLGGALGNLADRLFRSPGPFRGHVVDFFSVFGPNGEHFPVFNTADCFITVGAVLLVLTALLGIDFDGTRGEKPSAAVDPTVDPTGDSAADPASDGAAGRNKADGADG